MPTETITTGHMHIATGFLQPGAALIQYHLIKTAGQGLHRRQALDQLLGRASNGNNRYYSQKYHGKSFHQNSSVSATRRQYFALAIMAGFADHAGHFHRFDQSGGAVITNLEFSLYRRDRCPA